ncbi:MAG: hypothetical protein PHI77_01040 [Candidatus Pacebacteria bacterium]|nr:hypothetical protein [Candidatus Paceibacterota bacterium]MDD4830597.1 hypothetical protein [Candidatus Paceibacterota bacterium]MDD4874973.1 hypothetical protein [Candidatus Paceibacterota bacterium]
METAFKQLPLFLKAPDEDETESFDVHISCGNHSLFFRQKVSKMEDKKEKIKKIKMFAFQNLIDFMKNNSWEAREEAGKMERKEGIKEKVRTRIRNSRCGFPQYKRPEKGIRWKTEGFEIKKDDGEWEKADILALNGEARKTQEQKRKRILMRAVQAALIAEIGDIRYSYLAITSPDTAYIGLDSEGKSSYEPEKIKKIFLQMDLLSALAQSIGYHPYNIPAPNGFVIDVI